MLTNTDCAVYNRHTDADGNVLIVQTHLDAVHWEPRKAANIIASGSKEADSISLWIPLQVDAGGSRYIDPVQFAALASPTGYWTLDDENTWLVKGSGPNITDIAGIKTLPITAYEQFKVTSVDPKMFGSQRMRHWEVSGK